MSSSDINAVLYKKNGQYLRVLGVTNGLDGTAVNDATVTATIVDDKGRTMLELTLPNVAGSNGDYQALVPDTFDPSTRVYIAMIDIVRDSLQGAHFELPVTVEKRQTVVG